MARPASDKKARLTEAAQMLAYTRGFEQTTIGDIAEQAQVAPGSVYYYFKTKDDVGRAIVDSLLARYSVLLSQWEASTNPRERLASYIEMNAQDAPTMSEYGCPIGSLCTEMRKHDAELGDEAAGILRMTMTWAAEQFITIGFSADEAHENAMHLVTAVQGAAALSNALNSTEPLDRESARLAQWVATTTP